MADLMKLLTEGGLQSGEFYIKQVDNEDHNISPTSIDAYDKIKKILEDNKIPHYTYTPKHKKPFTVFLKELRGNIATGESVRKELTSKKL